MIMDDDRGNAPVVVGVPGYASLVISLHQDKSRGRLPSLPYRRQAHGVRFDHLETGSSRHGMYVHQYMACKDLIMYRQERYKLLCGSLTIKIKDCLPMFPMGLSSLCSEPRVLASDTFRRVQSLTQGHGGMGKKQRRRSTQIEPKTMLKF